MSTDDRLAEIVSSLERLIEDLDDIAFEELHAAVSAGERERPKADRRLTQARRALEKARHLLEET